MEGIQPPLSYIGEQVWLVLESYEERRDALVLKTTRVGETVERVKEVLRDQRFGLKSGFEFDVSA